MTRYLFMLSIMFVSQFIISIYSRILLTDNKINLRPLQDMNTTMEQID